MWHLLQLDWAGVCFPLKRTAAENVLILRADCLPNLTPGVAKGLRHANNGRIHGALLPCCPQLSWGLGPLKGPPLPPPTVPILTAPVPVEWRR